MRSTPPLLLVLYAFAATTARATTPFTGITCEVGTQRHEESTDHGKLTGCRDAGGLWHGTRLLWAGRRLVERAEYRAGKRHGFTWTFQVNGELESMGEYRDDRQDGIWSYFVGKPLRKVLEGEFRGGRRHGVWVQWDVSGAVLGMLMFENGTGRYVRWGATGERVEDGDYVDGRRTGVWREYRRDMSLVTERVHVDDHDFLERTFDDSNRVLKLRCVVGGKTAWEGPADTTVRPCPEP